MPSFKKYMVETDRVSSYVGLYDSLEVLSGLLGPWFCMFYYEYFAFFVS